jgi:hypothetical protein
MADTRADGSFRLVGLADRAYNLFAGTALAGFGVRRGVRPGDEEVVLSLRPGGRVRVSVRGPDGAAVAGAYVHVSSAGGAAVSPESVSPTDAQGIAEIAAPRGAVEIEAGTLGPAERLQGSVTVAVPEGGSAAAELVLAPKAER